MKSIGFIGLGHMGLPMAINLVKAGLTVTGFDLQPEQTQQLEAAGGLRATSPAALAKNQDAVITMLQKGSQVEQVCFGTEGIYSVLKKNAYHIDCSTIDVTSARKIHQAANEHHISMIDAPVSGGVVGANAGTLTFMVGGEEETFNQCRPLLKQMGKTIIYAGQTGSGQAAKICNNMILGISMIGISEAFILAESLGLSNKKLHEVVTNASGQCWAMDRYVPVPGILENVPANHDYQPGFSAAMMLKDLHLSQDAAQTSEVTTPLAAKATQLYEKLNQTGHGDLDFSAIIELLKYHS